MNHRKLALLLVLPLLPSQSHAFDTIGAVWERSEFPIPYYINNEFGDLDEEDAIEAIKAGFKVWEDVECAGLKFAYKGLIDDAEYGANDGKNVVFYIADNWPEEASLLSSPVLYVNNGEEIVETDFAINAVDYRWRLKGADGKLTFDVTSAVVHEVGHMLGLWHSDVMGASLNPAMDGHPAAVKLHDDDIAGICSIYDKDDATDEGGDDETDGDSGAEIGDVGSAAIGQSCKVHADCEGQCLKDGAEQYCTEDCDADADCPEEFVCESVGYSSGGVCAKSSSANGDTSCSLAAEQSDLAALLRTLFGLHH